MRYRYEKPAMFLSMYGHTYICDNPVYNTCILTDDPYSFAKITYRIMKDDKGGNGDGRIDI